VLRLAKLPLGGHAYYLEVAAGTGSGIEAAGTWAGTGPGVLGLEGAVETDHLAAVLGGRDPATGAVLGGARARVTVAGFDLTFAAPKSVSLLHALGDDTVRAAVGAGHQAAVEAALGYVERHALAVRRGSGEARRVEAAEGTATAAFVHRVSRAEDPHLHTHVVTANLARGPDGRWSALDGRGLYAHVGAAGALYHAQLRHELRTRLGVGWGPLDRGRADLEGIGPQARRAFSTRAAQIGDELARYGSDPRRPPTARARHVAWAATRAARDPQRPVEAMASSWQERARDAGIGPRVLASVVDRFPRQAAELPAPEDLSRAVAAQLAGRPSVTRRDVVRASCGLLPAGADAPVLEAAVDGVMGVFVRALDRDAPPPGSACLDGPGVAERRLPALDGRGAQLEVLLARRGHRIGADRRLGYGRDAGADGGLGLG